MRFAALYLIEILHQTTTFTVGCAAVSGCILSKFYIKPQQFSIYSNIFIVVSYRNSTSNHNCKATRSNRRTVVSYRNSTSNHNSAFATASATPLYLIEILHQTTTQGGAIAFNDSCILSKFYIKPQLFRI